MDIETMEALRGLVDYTLENERDHYFETYDDMENATDDEIIKADKAHIYVDALRVKRYLDTE